MFSKLTTGVISLAHGLAMTVGTIFISTSGIKKLRLREVESLGLGHEGPRFGSQPIVIG